METTTNYQDVFDHANDAIFIHDEATGEILDANRMAARITGFTVPLLRKMQVGDLSARLRGFNSKGALGHIHSAVTEGPQLFEWWLKRPDGTEIPTEVNLKRIISNGCPRVIALVRDISERKEAEQRLVAREAYYRRLIANISDGIAILDRSGRVLWVGPSIQKVLGFRERDVRGRNVFERIAPDERERLREQINMLCQRSGGEESFCYPVQHCDGSWRIIEGSCVNLLEDDRVGGLLVTFRDVTSRIEADERIRERELELSHVARLSTTGEMASALAHELNQPFFAIMNFLGGAIRRAQSGRLEHDALLEVLESARAQAERAGRIIRTVRNFTRKSEFHRERVDIRKIIEEIAPFIDIEARSKRVSVRYRLLRQPAIVLCDWVLIEQVIANIARNGIEAMLETPVDRRQLTLSTYTTATDTVVVCIEDSGHGLPWTNPDRIFDAFFTTKKEGLGIGLSLCRSIIDSHGGHLWATKGHDNGAKFHFTLPLVPSSKETEP